MSYLNINPDLFLGSQELNRLVKSLDEDGFRKLFLKDAISFGLFNNSYLDGVWDNFKVEQGTNVGTIKHAEGFAVDLNGKIIYRAANDNIELIDNNSWYWIKISFQNETREVGLCSIDSSGNLTGSGTEFLKTLRGLPNNPVKVAFLDSALNTDEYEAVEVISEETAILAGDFTPESNLRYSVVGAFTPGISVPADSKYPFQYNGCTMTLVLEAISNTAPELDENEEFLIARVKRNGVAVTVQDKRSRNIYRSKADYLQTLTDSANPLLGVESIKFDNQLAPRNENIVKIEWSFYSANWTIDSNTNKITLNSGTGGKFKTTADFTDGDFDGWRCYPYNGKYFKVRSSAKSGGQINLILESLDPDDFIDATKPVIITPDAEEIELLFTGGGVSNATKKFILPIYSLSNCYLNLPVFESPTCDYTVTYRYKTHNQGGTYRNMPSDAISGYLNESSFDEDGVQDDTNRTTYASNIIILEEASNAYNNRLTSVETGDLFGVARIELDNANPVIDLEVGISEKIQLIETIAIVDGGLGSPYTFTTDHYFNLKTDAAAIQAGNTFEIVFNVYDPPRSSGTFYDPDGFNIIITQDYVNAGDTGTILYEFIGKDNTALSGDSAGDYQAMLDGPLKFQCVFNGTDWIVTRIANNTGRVSLDAGAGENSRIVLGNRETNTTPYINFNSHGSAASDYDSRIIATGGTGTAGQGTLNFLVGALQINGVAVVAGGVATTRTVTAGSGLSGGGDLSANRTFDVNVDSTTIEISSDTLRIAATAAGSGLTGGGGSALAVNVDSTTIEISSDTLRIAATAAGSGLSGGGGSALAVNVDNSTIEINADSLRLKDGGVTAAKIAAQGAWTALTLNGGGGASYIAGARTPQYRVDTLGQVHLRGIINTSGSPPAGDHAVTTVALPIPSQRQDFIQWNDNFTSATALYIHTDGIVRANSSLFWGGVVILDGLSYWTS